MDDGWTLEVSRCCTDGTKNATSKLYAQCWKITSALGYRKLITYTLIEESGSSLKGAGWKVVHKTSGKSGWHKHPRPGAKIGSWAKTGVSEVQKYRWEILSEDENGRVLERVKVPVLDDDNDNSDNQLTLF